MSLSTLLPLVGVVLLAGSVMMMVAITNYPVSRRPILPGILDLGRAGAVLALALLVVVIGVVAVLAFRTGERGVPRPYRRFIGGLAGPVIATLGVFFGVGYISGLAYGVLQLLRPGDDPSSLTLPLFYLRISYAAGIVVMLAVWLAAFLAVWFHLSARRFRSLAQTTAGGGLPEDEVRPVARAYWLAVLKYKIHWLAVVLAVVGGALTVAAVVEAVGETGTQICHPSGTWLSDCRDLPGFDVVTVGTIALLGLAGFLGYLGKHAIDDSGVRRLACVIWDIVSFWPEAVHPFVPSAYSPKAVDDLRRRIEWHVSRPDTFLVLTGHSQGSLIAVAALARLSQEHRGKVALLTSGSQLQTAYARAFPAYVNYRFLSWLKTHVLMNRWISLYRETDPIGGPVLSWDHTHQPDFRSRRLGADDVCVDDHEPSKGVRRCGSEWQLFDPSPSDGVLTPRHAMRRHTGFSAEPAWALALTELTTPAVGDELPPRRPATP